MGNSLTTMQGRIFSKTGCKWSYLSCRIDGSEATNNRQGYRRIRI
jgi:hypothetical protein